MCEFSLKASVQKIMKNLFAKIVESASFLFKAFQRAI